MRAVLRLTDDDLPPHVDDIAIGQLTLFAVRKDTFADELVISSLNADGRRPERRGGRGHHDRRSREYPPSGGAAWQAFAGRAPAGDWEMRLPDNARRPVVVRRRSHRGPRAGDDAVRDHAKLAVGVLREPLR